jgi:DNA-binding response OmpR family regulator
MLAQRPETKVLFMSGYSENVIVHQGVIDEGVNLIEKPFSVDDLLRRIREILDGDS